MAFTNPSANSDMIVIIVSSSYIIYFSQKLNYGSFVPLITVKDNEYGSKILPWCNTGQQQVKRTVCI